MAKETIVDKVLFETKTCTGCRTCELACSFHHAKVFQPSISSIIIKSDPKKLGFSVILYRNSAEGHIACNRCKGLPIPLCVQSCPSMVRDELDHFMRMG